MGFIQGESVAGFSRAPGVRAVVGFVVNLILRYRANISLNLI